MWDQNAWTTVFLLSLTLIIKEGGYSSAKADVRDLTSDIKPALPENHRGDNRDKELEAHPQLMLSAPLPGTVH